MNDNVWQPRAYKYRDLAAKGSVPMLRDAFARVSAAHVVIDIQRIYMDLAHPYNKRLTKAECNAHRNLVASVAAFTEDMRGHVGQGWAAHVGSRELLTHRPPRPDGAATGWRWRDWRGYDGQYSPAQMEQQARREVFCAAARADDFYIGKYYQDAFRDTDFDTGLKARGIDTLILTGIMAEECVAKTAQAALDRKYRVVLVPDLTMYRTRPSFEQAWDALERAGALFAHADTVRSALQP